MTCPQCYYQVRTKSYWQATGLSGLVCPNCETSLRPTYWRSVTLYLLAFGLGYGMEFLLEMVGVGRWIAFLGFLGMLFLAYLTFATPILRFQIKEDDASAPHPPNH